MSRRAPVAKTLACDCQGRTHRMCRPLIEPSCDCRCQSPGVPPWDNTVQLHPQSHSHVCVCVNDQYGHWLYISADARAR